MKKTIDGCEHQTSPLSRCSLASAGSFSSLYRRLGLSVFPSFGATLSVLLAIFTAVATSPVALAQNTANTWNGTTTGALGTAGNWSLGTVPTVTNDAVFSSAVGTGIRALSATNLTVGSFNVTAPSGTYSIRNNTSTATNSTLTVGGAGNLGNGVSGTSTDLLYAASGSKFNIIGANGGGGSGTLILALGQNGTFNIAGTSEISAAITGTGFGITKTGTGNLTLNATNSFTGPLTLNAGNLTTITNGLSTSTAIIVNGGNANVGQGTVASVTLNNGTLSGAAKTITAANYFLNGGTLSQQLGVGNLTVATGTTTVNNNIGALSVTISSGNLTLVSSNRLADTANVLVSGGVLNLGANSDAVGNFTMTSGSLLGTGSLTAASYTISSGTVAAVLMGASGLTKNTSGTVTLSGNNTYSGATNINAGLVEVSKATAFGSNSSGTTVANGGGVRFTNAATFTENFTISGNGSNGHGALYASPISGSQSVNISGSVTLADNATISALATGGGGALQLIGPVNSGASSGTTILTLTGNSTSGSNLLSGIVSDGTTGAKLGIVKEGTGTWVLGGTSIVNTFTGGIQVNSGTIALGGTGGKQFGDNVISLGSLAGGDATISIAPSSGFSTGGSTGTVLLVNPGTGNRTLIVSTDNNNTLNWKIILDNNLTVGTTQATKAINLASEIVGGSDLVFTRSTAGTAAHSLNNAANAGANGQLNTRNLFTGNMVVSNTALLQFGSDYLNFSGATLNVLDGGKFNLQSHSILGGLNGQSTGVVVGTNSAKTLTLAGNGNYSFSGSINNGTTQTVSLVVRLNKEGVQGSQTLAGNNSYTGTTALQGGTLRLDYSTANGSKLSNSSALTLSGGTIDLAGGSHTEVVGSTTLSNGFNTISRSSGSSVLALGTLTNSGGGINFSADNIATTNSTNSNGLLHGKAVFTVGGADWAYNSTNASNGAIVGFSAGNYTAISNSTNLTAGNWNHYLATGDVTLAHGQYLYLGTLKIDPTDAGQSFKITGGGSGMLFRFGNNTTNGGILFTGAHDYSLFADGNGTINTDTAIFNYSSANLTIGKFGNALRFFGNGTTILSQNSAADATMSIYGGTVRFSSNAQLGNAANPNSNFQLFGGTFLADTAGGNISLTRPNGTSHRNITLGYNAPRIDVIGGNTLTIGGVISSSGNVFSPIVFGSSTASGTIVLGGTNTFFGDVRLEGATLSVGADAQLGDVGNMLVFGGNATFKTTGSFTANRAVAINSGYTGTFSPNAGTTFTLSQPIRGAGNLEMNGAGTLILSGSSLYTGATKISQGILSITSVNATAKSSGIQISGGAGLTYTGGVATLGQNITVTSGTGYLRNSGAGVLTLGGNISKNGSILRLSQGSFAVTGAITGSAANSDLYLESGGTITFSGSNTYNGPTYLLNGTTLNANSAGALSASSNLIMDDTGSGSSVLNLGANQATGSIAGAASSAINLGSHTLTSNSASSTTFAGAISGDGGLTKAGAGTLSLSGSNTYNGSTAITGGTLSLGTGGTAGSLGSGSISISSGAALVANRSNALTLANTISGAGDIVQTGSGNTTLSGTNTNTGAVRATAGQLRFDGANALSTGISLLEVDNATLSLADGTARTSNLASASLESDTGTFVFDIAASASDMLVFGGSATLAGTRTINLNFLETLSSGQSWVLMNATGGGFGGNWTLGTTSGAGQSGFTFSLSATSNALTLTAATSSSTYYWKGDLDANWGTTSGGDSNWASDSSGASLRSNAPSSGSDVIFAATGAGNLSTTLGADRTIQSLTVSVGGVEINGANTLTMQSSSATGTLVNAASGTVTIGATLAGASTGLTKEGASLLVLTGNNTYGGGTTLSGGTLRIGSDAALGNSTAAITLSGDAVLQASGNLTLGASRPVVVSGNGSLDTQSHTITVAGVLDGAGILQKTGAGSLVLNSANTLSGTLSPAAGTLVLGNENALSSATLSMGGGNLSFSSSVGGNAFTLGGLSAASSGTGYDIQLQNTAGQAIALTVGSSNASTTYAASLGGNGSLVKAGSGSLTLSGNNTYTGTTTLNAGTLAVTGSLSATPSITINGGTLSLDSNNAVASTTTITLADASGTAFNVTANQTIGGLRGGGTSGGTTSISASQTLEVQESGTQSYNGTITGAGSFRFNGSGALTLGGAVSNTGGITVSSGNLTIASANTYTGGTTLAGGVLNINNATALSSGIFTITGGTLGNTSGADVTLGAVTQQWNGDFSYSPTTNRTLNLGTGPVTLGANRTITVQSGTLTVAGGISGTGLGLTKTGNGTLRLQGINSFTGGIDINEGTLVVAGGSAIADTVAVTIANTTGASLSVNSAESIASLRGGGANSGGVVIGSGVTFTVSESGNQTFAGPLAGSGTFIKQSTGTINLTNNSSTLSGQIWHYAGTLAVSSIGMNGSASPLGSNGTILVGGGGPQGAVLRWEGVGNETTNKNINTDTNNGEAGPFNRGAEIFAVNPGSTLTISGNITSSRLALKTLTLNGSGGSIVVSGTISNGANATHTMQALVTGTGNATHAFENTNNSFTGAVTIQSGAANESIALRVTSVGNTGANSSLGTNGTIHIGANATGSTSALVYAGTGETSNKVLNLQGTIGNVALEQAGTGNLKFTSNLTVTGAGAKQLILQGSTAGTGEIAGLIVDSASGATSLVKNGTGAWILSGANTYTGNTTLNGGTLQLSGNGALGSGSITLAGGTLDLGGKSLANTISGLTGGGLQNGTITNNGGNYAFQDGTISAVLAGTNGLTKTGSGSLALTGNNSFTGSTTISAGNLSISQVGALASTSGVTLDNATALLYTGSAATLDRSISVTSGTGTIRNNGSGLLTLSGALAKDGTTLTLQGGSNGITVSGAISGASANSDLVIDGGTVTLASANSYNGPTYIINSGTLNANTVGALPTGTLSAVTINGSSTLALGASQSVASLSGTSGSSVNLNANTLTINGSSDTTYSGGISGTGNLVKNGSGNQTLAGATTYTGTTTINSGTLQATSAGALSSTSSAVIHNSGSLLVTADTINDSASVNLSGGTLALNGTFNETVGALTLSANSVIDLNGFTGTLRFGSLASFAAGATLSIWNWNGINRYGTPVGNGLSNRHIVFTNATGLSSSLSYISFYSGNGTGFSGTGFEEGFSEGGTEIGAVPEPETWATAFLLLIGSGFWIWKQRKQRKRTADA